MKTTRLERMRELFLQMPYISLSELAAIFPEISEMTLRRDIDTLGSGGCCHTRARWRPFNEVYHGNV